MEISSGGWPLWQGQFTPFGSELPDGSTAMHYKFTGKERDSESGLDYFGARYYASAMGRWMSPDWSPVPIAVPYANLGNPQSLNLYQYVGNNPLGQSDADGHHWWNKLGNLFTDAGCWCEGAEAAASAQRFRQEQAEADARAAAANAEFLSKPGNRYVVTTLLIFAGDPEAQSAMSGAGTSSGVAPETIEPEAVVPEITIDSAQHPASAGHASDAQASGYTSDGVVNRSGASANRREALKNVQGAPGMDRDEYPPAVLRPNGSSASTRLIPSSDNRGAGASVGNQIRNLPDGTKVKIVVK